jgi:hypothetical protein
MRELLRGKKRKEWGKNSKNGLYWVYSVNITYAQEDRDNIGIDTWCP